MFHDWLRMFFYDNYHILYDNSVITSNFYVGVLKLTPAQVAYLLAKFSKHFSLSLTELVDNMTDFSCECLVEAAQKVGKKRD